MLPLQTPRSVRFAHYRSPTAPPVVDELSGDACELIDSVSARVAECSVVPPVAAREIIENLAHADFAGACVSVLDGGATLRVSDCGPGIDDKQRAMEPGYSTAVGHVRAIVRGVGSGLAVTQAAMSAVGGSVEIDDNLDMGTVVTLRAPRASAATPSQPTADGGDEADVTETGRRLLAVLLEIGPAVDDQIARELGAPPHVCARELALLERAGMITLQQDGRRALTADGSSLLTTLF